MVQQGNDITNRGPVVLVSRRGGEASRAIEEWERQNQAGDLLHSSGLVEPVTIQAITRTYDLADQTLWIPRDQWPEPMDDSIVKYVYFVRPLCF